MSEQPRILIFQKQTANITLDQPESLRVKEAQGRVGVLSYHPKITYSDNDRPTPTRAWARPL